MKRKQNTLPTSSADVVDNHLILSLTNAVEPVVWRMALDQIGTASFDIKEVKTSGHFKLNLKPKKGAAETIATFETKDDALAALMQSSEAMQKPAQSSALDTSSKEKNINIITPQATPTQSTGINKWVKLLLGFFIVIGLYAYLMSVMPNRVNNLGNAPVTNSTNSSQPQSGVPMSADDFLSGM